MNYTLSAHSFNEPTLLAPPHASFSPLCYCCCFLQPETRKKRGPMRMLAVIRLHKNLRTVAADPAGLFWEHPSGEPSSKLQRFEDVISQAQTRSVSQSVDLTAQHSSTLLPLLPARTKTDADRRCAAAGAQTLEPGSHRPRVLFFAQPFTLQTASGNGLRSGKPWFWMEPVPSVCSSASHNFLLRVDTRQFK